MLSNNTATIQGLRNIMDFMSVLTNPQIYQEKIIQLEKKLRLKNTLHNMEQEGISFYHFNTDQKHFSKILANSIRKQNYQLDAVKLKTIQTRNKKRVVYQLSILDYLMESVFCDYLNLHLNKLASKHLFSYIKGRSANQAARTFAGYIRTQLQTNTRHSDIYVIRTDICNYFDTIPVGAESPLWAILQELLQDDKSNKFLLTPYLWSLLKDMIRPIIISKNGIHLQNIIGIPTGTPIASMVANIYLHHLDDMISKHMGSQGFYARYSDDLLLAHINPQELVAAEQLIINTLCAYGLQLNNKKNLYYYLTHAGRSSPYSPFQGSASINFLGYAVTSQGTIAFDSKTVRQVLLTLRDRMAASMKFFFTNNPNERAKMLCDATNKLIDPTYPLSLIQFQSRLHYITDRAQLKQFDYEIALKAAEILSGIKGSQAFRKIPYQDLRNKYGLRSLCQIKNNMNKQLHETDPQMV